MWAACTPRCWPGPWTCALCLFSLFRHGRSSLATELHQLRSKENGVPACEITLSPGCKIKVTSRSVALNPS